MIANKFFAELKRRNVYKVGIAYIVGGWGAFSRNCTGIPRIRCSKLDYSIAGGADHRGYAGRARPLLDV